MFGVERRVNGQRAQTRRAAREEQRAPLLEDLKAYLETSLARISGKSDLAEAIRYASLAVEGADVFPMTALEIRNNTSNEPSAR